MPVLIFDQNFQSYSTSIVLNTSVLRIFKGEKVGNLRIIRTKKKKFIHKGRSRLEDYIGHFTSSLLPINIIVNMLCFCFNCDFKLRWLWNKLLLLLLPLRISPFSYPKLNEDQKRGLSSDFVRFWAQTFCLSYKGGGGPFRNFAYYSMLIILYWRPKHGGPWHQAPPKYASGPYIQNQQYSLYAIKPLDSCSKLETLKICQRHQWI